MTAEQRADEVKNFFLVLSEKEQDAVWIEMTKLAYKLNARRTDASNDNIKKLARKLDAAVVPNNITMDEIVEECREARKTIRERGHRSLSAIVSDM